MIEDSLQKLAGGGDLSREEMTQAMELIMTGGVATPEVVSFLESLRRKGESVEELTAAVSVMRSHSRRIHPHKDVVLDTCGTGGDQKGTFNISTTVAFVAAGCGVCVAKHGNRSISSCCGSADILEAMGVDIHMPIEKIEKCLDEVGLAFLFAPDFHPAMKHAMPARKQIGGRTIFNLIGPLTNPAGAHHQLIGVFDGAWTEPVARVLGNLGTRHALVVHGDDGLDEITTTAGTEIAEIHNGKLTRSHVCPEDFGMKRAALQELAGGTVSDNVAIVLGVFQGNKGPCRDIVVINAAAALYAVHKAGSIHEGVALAQDSIDSGKAMQKLESLIHYSRS